MNASQDLTKQPLIQCENIKKYYPVKDRQIRGKGHFVHAVDNVSFSIYKGQIFGVVGESGSGKSTIGRCIINLENTTGGKIIFKGQPINNLGSRQLKPIRHDIQMVFQNPFASFNPKKSVGKMFTELGRTYGLKKKESIGRANEFLEMVSLLPQFEMMTRYPKNLSGGQLQRLAIARALMLNPEFLIADEPVSALDVSVQAQILNLFVSLRNELDLTILFISHDLTVVRNICDMVAVVYLGTIVEMGSTEALFSNIAHPYSQALISAKPKNHPDDETHRIVLHGEIPNAIDVGEGCRFADRCPYCKEDVCKKKSPVLTEIGEGHYVSCHFPLNINLDQKKTKVGGGSL